MKFEYDIVVIGGGSAGLTGARFAARLGAKVALVEKHRIGGDCTWTGCVPSKALLRAAKVAQEIRTAGDFGIEVGAPTVDMTRVRAHIRKSIESVYQAEKPEVLEEEGIEVILAPTQFVDAHTLQVGERRLQARRFVVCTGARPFVPPIPGLADVPYLTHESIFDNDRLPRHLLIIGAGPIGLEMAQAYSRLGSEVSLLSADFLPREDAEVRELISAIMTRECARLAIGPIESVRAEGDEIVVACPGSEARGDMLLVATGRRPNVDGLGLQAAGVEYSDRGIAADPFLRTNVGHIYAAGDVLGGLQFTHLAGWQCFQAVRNALLPGRAHGHPAVMPKVTFLDPEVASVGLTEDEARVAHGPDVIRVHRWEMKHTDRALTEGKPEGLIKIVARSNGRILGASIVADRAGEMIAEFVLAMDRGFGLSELSTAVHAYPTWSTAVQQAASAEALERFLSSLLGRFALRLSGLPGHPTNTDD